MYVHAQSPNKVYLTLSATWPRPRGAEACTCGLHHIVLDLHNRVNTRPNHDVTLETDGEKLQDLEPIARDSPEEKMGLVQETKLHDSYYAEISSNASLNLRSPRTAMNTTHCLLAMFDPVYQCTSETLFKNLWLSEIFHVRTHRFSAHGHCNSSLEQPISLHKCICQHHSLVRGASTIIGAFPYQSGFTIGECFLCRLTKHVRQPHPFFHPFCVKSDSHVNVPLLEMRSDVEQRLNRELM